jgi:AcrR family transcriptional regulator
LTGDRSTNFDEEGTMSRREQAQASRETLLIAAQRCFAADGYEATTVASILSAAGMARGALYHYFPDGKRDIFNAVFDKLNDEYHRQRDSAASNPSPLARIVVGMRAFLECCTQPDFAQIVLKDGPRVIPSQAGPGSSYRLLVGELDAAVAANEVELVDTSAFAMILYGATLSAGDYVINSTNRAAGVAVAGNSLERLVAGLDQRR